MLTIIKLIVLLMIEGGTPFYRKSRYMYDVFFLQNRALKRYV